MFEITPSEHCMVPVMRFGPWHFDPEVMSLVIYRVKNTHQ